ncbi:DUF5020 family protein [Lacimicrobium alkaliphilum]|uniref:Ion channel protein Tsx n=1 Tax=Lacimicrobium alkaliphilum TaxID=1526571 RepID=A0ABQ1R3Z0_9ALTE|nr:DUF5020 family protein [Lacimicrobium alkaliphilum]GGD54897.1 ion channel protein Tsx [Lacimicrobium alkaliphilum]
MKAGLILLLVLFHSHLALASFQEARLSYLYGENYRIGESDRQVITLEHVASTDWGDSFFFLDHMRFADGTRTNYAELQPRFSLSKKTSTSFVAGPIKDVLIAGHVEMGSNATNFLYGMGVDLDIPGFQFFQVNGYRRNNDDKANNWQLTLVWAVPWRFGEQQFVFDGFADWASTSSDQRANLNITPQLKWLASDVLGIKSKLYLGFEYVYWRNKFGIANSAALASNENNLNLLIKWHF